MSAPIKLPMPSLDLGHLETQPIDIELVSPRVAAQSAGNSPRSPCVPHFDSPRPTDASVQRRLSQVSNKLGKSPLRYSQSEMTFAHFVKPLKPLVNDDATKKVTTSTTTTANSSESNHATARKLATTSGSPKTYVSKQVPDGERLHVVALNPSNESSPPLGRLGSHPAPLYLLEEVFHSPGGGKELKTVLGVYTSRRAAEYAGHCYWEQHKEDKSHFEHLRLVTSEVPVDKAASETRRSETLDVL